MVIVWRTGAVLPRLLCWKQDRRGKTDLVSGRSPALGLELGPGLALFFRPLTVAIFVKAVVEAKSLRRPTVAKLACGVEAGTVV